MEEEEELMVEAMKRNVCCMFKSDCDVGMRCGLNRSFTQTPSKYRQADGHTNCGSCGRAHGRHNDKGVGGPDWAEPVKLQCKLFHRK